MPTTAFRHYFWGFETLTNINRGAPLLLLLPVVGVITHIADNNQMNREVVVSVLFSYLCSWAKHFRLVDKFNTGL